MIHIWFLYHGAHGVLDRAIGELIVSVLVPDGLEVEIGPPDLRLEKCQIASVRDRFGIVVEVGGERGGKR